MKNILATEFKFYDCTLWKDLDAYVTDLFNRTTGNRREIWKSIDQKPLTVEGIYLLGQEGWHIEFVELPQEPNYGLCLRDKKRIVLNKSSKPYEHDKTLFHELVHAWLGDVANDGYFSPWDVAKENNAIVEWLGRQYRASPPLLRTALTAFDLPIHAYDKASYLAKYPNNAEKPIVVSRTQLALPFPEKHIDCMRTWMD